MRLICQRSKWYGLNTQTHGLSRGLGRVEIRVKCGIFQSQSVTLPSDGGEDPFLFELRSHFNSLLRGKKKNCASKASMHLRSAVALRNMLAEMLICSFDV